MEQNLNTVASLLPGGNPGKGKAAIDPEQNKNSMEEFGTLVLEASRDNTPKAQSSGTGVKQPETDELEQQLLDLSAKLEDQLDVAAQENAPPEAVEEILAEFVSDLWALLNNFDAAHNTQLVSGFSASLQQAGLETKGTVLMQAGMGQKITDLTAAVVQPGEKAFFSRLIGLTTAPDASASRAQIQLNDASAKVLKPSLNISQNSLGAEMQGQNSGQRTSGFIASPLPENIQQFAMATPVKNSTSGSGNIAGEPNAVNKVNALVSPLTGGGEVGAKLAELLTVSARKIVSGKEMNAGIVDNGGIFNSPKASIAPPNIPVKPEQPAPASGFSKNIANQIQEVTLNPGRTRIELAPRGLGSVIIDLHPKESGGLQVVLRAENPSVLHALRTDREVLLAVLSNDNVQQENISLNFESFGQSGFGQDQDDSEDLGVKPDQNEPEDDAVLVANRPGTHGQLDFFT
jgi:hypothetical protein